MTFFVRGSRVQMKEMIKYDSVGAVLGRELPLGFDQHMVYSPES